MVRLDKPRRDYLDMLFAITITLIGLYPLYRDDLARWKLWAEQKFRRNAEPEPPREWLRDLYDDLR